VSAEAAAVRRGRRRRIAKKCNCLARMLTKAAPGASSSASRRRRLPASLPQQWLGSASGLGNGARDQASERAERASDTSAASLMGRSRSSSLGAAAGPSIIENPPSTHARSQHAVRPTR
jgi:hypothetical protein